MNLPILLVWFFFMHYSDLVIPSIVFVTHFISHPCVVPQSILVFFLLLTIFEFLHAIHYVTEVSTYLLLL